LTVDCIDQFDYDEKICLRFLLIAVGAAGKSKLIDEWQKKEK